VLAFIDVDNLKAVNDSRGHAAGDKLLRDVANAVRAHVRSYDLLIRFGGDEFVCGLADLSMSAASTRFDRVNAELAALHASIGVGLAELGEHDELEDLLARADLVRASPAAATPSRLSALRRQSLPRLALTRPGPRSGSVTGADPGRSSASAGIRNQPSRARRSRSRR